MPTTARHARGILLAAVLALTACQTPGQSLSSASPSPAPDIFSRPGGVNVGTVTDQPGFGQLTPGDNVRSGFDVDLYRWLGNNVPPTFTPLPVDLTIDERIGALKDGKVQLVVETFSITDKRREVIGFAGPYMITQQGVMVRTGDDRIGTLEDLSGKTVCTLSGGTSLDQLNAGSLKDRINVTVERGIKGCVDRLLQKQVDAVSVDEISLQGFVRNDPANLAVVKNLTFGAKDRFGVGLPHGDVAACETMTNKLRTFITNGAWDSFFSLHFPDVPHEKYKPDPYNLDPCE